MLPERKPTSKEIQDSIKRIQEANPSHKLKAVPMNTTAANKAKSVNRIEAVKRIKEGWQDKPAYYTGNILTYAHNLFKDEDGKFDEQTPYDIKYTCLELLALMTDPEICSKLPKYAQATVGKNLMKLYEFAASMDDDQYSHSALMAYEIDQYYTNAYDDITPDTIQGIIDFEY